MADRLRTLLRGVTSLVLLLVLVAGPPFALVRYVGWPLPAGLPSLDELTQGARSGIDPMAIVKTLAALGWLAWAQIALAVATEAVALIRRAPSPHLPVLPGVQPGVGHLLAGAALLVSSFSIPRSAPVQLSLTPIADVAAAPAAASPVSGPDDLIAPLATQARRAPATDNPAGKAQRSYVVERNDSWWQIAETTTGDGLRWQQIRSMNIGRGMPDGTVIAADTDALREGWTLLVPDSTDPVTGTQGIAAADVVVERGDNLWDLAEEHLEDSIDRQATDNEIAPYWLDVIEENRPRLVDPANPSLIYPGQTVHLPAADGAESPAGPVSSEADPVPDPAVDGTAPVSAPPAVPATPGTTPPATAAPTSTSTTAPPVTQEEPAGPQAQETDLGSGETIPVGGALGVAGTLLAVGVSAAALRRRRRREQLLPPGTRPPDMSPRLDDLRTEVAVRRNLDQIELLEVATASIAAALRSKHSSGRARLIQVGADHAEVLLSEPILPAPPGWRPEGSGTAWILEDPAGLDVTSIDETPGTPTHPLLISLGIPDADGQIYMDLEAEGLVDINGDDADVAGFTRSVILELSTSPLAAGTAVYVCGEVPGTPSGPLDRVTAAECWDDIADSVLSWAHQTRNIQSANRWSTPSIGRIAGARADDLAPVVVVLAEQPEDERFTALCTTISESIIPVVIMAIGTGIEGATSIEARGGHLRIPRLDVTCVAQEVDADAAAEISELLEQSEQVPEQLEVVPEPSASNNGHGRAGADSYTDPPFDILVKVLGDIEVIGGNQPLTPKPTAVVAFVALNSPVSSERVQDAIWSAPTENRKKRLANTVSETRSAIGAEHLPAATDGKYRVGAGVVTDLELLERRIEHAKSQNHEAAIETLRGALELVRGPVFTYRNADRAAFGWVDRDNWISAAELRVTGLAEHLAHRFLDAGEVESAAWAAQRGLKAVPTHPRLTAALMQAYVSAGDSHAACTVYESYAAALEELGIDDVDPDLAELYERTRFGESRPAIG